MRASNPGRGESRLTIGTASVILGWTFRGWEALFAAYETRSMRDVLNRVFGGHPDDIHSALVALTVEGDAEALWKEVQAHSSEELFKVHDAVCHAAQNLPGEGPSDSKMDIEKVDAELGEVPVATG